jgi:Tfp pilus assembly protein PilN
MAVVDHFKHKTDAGFVRTYDAQAARRQFQVSVLLVFILAIAVFALGVLVRFNVPASVAETNQLKLDPTHFAEAQGTGT